MSERYFLIAGDRNWNCGDVASRLLNAMIAKHGNTFTIIHGDATGVDASFREACNRLGVDQIVVPANWNGVTRPEALVRHKDGVPTAINAGPRRNQRMFDIARALGGPAACIALHRRLSASKGTRGMAEICLRAGVPVWLVDGKDAKLRRITEID